MKTRILASACLVCFYLSAAAGQVTVSVAPDAASREDIQKLFAVMNSPEQVHRMMEQMMAQMRSMNRAQIKKTRPNISDEELARLDQRSEDLIKNFPFDAMLDDMIPIYQRHFSKTDVNSMTSFYSSPTGQKFLREMPAVMAESMQAMYPRIQRQIEAVSRQEKEQDQKTTPVQSEPVEKK
jgi:hypothetical protein